MTAEERTADQNSAANPEQKITRSCADCATTVCNRGDGDYPGFCLTAAQANDEVLNESLALFEEEENQRMMQCAAAIEQEFYNKMNRVEEIMEFARRMGYRKLGIANCVGLQQETRILTNILRHNGFEVFGVSCKVGAVPKESVGIEETNKRIGGNICNPINQAKRLAAEQTDFNIVVGLCVGHDTLFYKYSEAPLTTLVVKDRVLGHNPVACLYTAHSYNRRLLQD